MQPFLLSPSSLHRTSHQEALPLRRHERKHKYEHLPPPPPQSTRRPCSCSSMSTGRSMKPTTITSTMPPTPRPSMVASASRRCSCISRRRRRVERRCSLMRRRSRAGASGPPARRRGWPSSRSRGTRCCSTGEGGTKQAICLAMPSSLRASLRPNVSLLVTLSVPFCTDPQSLILRPVLALPPIVSASPGIPLPSPSARPLLALLPPAAGLRSCTSPRHPFLPPI